MSERCTIKVTMKLCSDTIFGSGYSIPGGEDIAVARNEKGYPYLKGTTFKGLLRESLENLLVWTGGSEYTLNAILGEEGWQGETGERRIQLTALTLERPPDSPEVCFSSRIFTKLEDGIVSSGTLRSASCIRRGLEFTGELYCAAEDEELILEALHGIRWGGTLRNRGFGQLSVSGKRVETAQVERFISPTCCIHYRIRTELPVMITNLSQSQENKYETRGVIPGSAVRGMVVNVLAKNEPDWFTKHKISLLTEQTRFLDAVPNPTDKAALPSPKGFYEDKTETQFENLLKNEQFSPGPGQKRAKLGSFCTLEENSVIYWSARTEGVMRIKRNIGKGENSDPFQTRVLSAGQDFEGLILLDDPEMAPVIAKAFRKNIWLGADRYEGYGKCVVTLLEGADCPAFIREYGYHSQKEITDTLYLMAISPFSMLDGNGCPCGLEEQQLADRLGVKRVTVQLCATSLVEVGGYNRTWQCRTPGVRMYDRGSLFRLSCEGEVPSLEAIRAIEHEGLGIRRAEGFGQVLFLPPHIFEILDRKREFSKEDTYTNNDVAVVRRAWYTWIMETSPVLSGNILSKSQKGSIQVLCEDALARGGILDDLQVFFKKNREDRGVRHGRRFQEVETLVWRVLETPLADTLHCDYAEDSIEKRLRLLIELFNFSRKEADT